MIVAEITIDSFPNAVTLTGRCTACSAVGPFTKRAERQDEAIAWIQGFFKDHILETGHRVVVESA